nr:melanocortin-2 receptor accessory protein isoform X2 [Oryctolagus cuniculus]
MRAGLPGAADMANRTNGSALYYSYEYYLDYLDLIPVDEKKLKANKHSIVIAFWVSLAAFVVLLFLILLLMSWSGSPHGSYRGLNCTLGTVQFSSTPCKDLSQ